MPVFVLLLSPEEAAFYRARHRISTMGTPEGLYPGETLQGNEGKSKNLGKMFCNSPLPA